MFLLSFINRPLDKFLLFGHLLAFCCPYVFHMFFFRGPNKLLDALFSHHPRQKLQMRILREKGATITMALRKDDDE